MQRAQGKANARALGRNFESQIREACGSNLAFRGGAGGLVTGSEGGDAVDGSTEHKIGDDGEHEGHDDDASDVNAMKDNVLIDSIEDGRDDQYFANMVPRFLQQTLAAFGPGEKGPQIWVAAFPRISQSGAYAKEGGYRRLQEQPEIHGPGGAVN